MNHLFIGLGGTGGTVLRSIRKLMYQSFREQEPDGVTIDYLYVDSDPKAFSDADPRWSLLGRSLTLGERNRCRIMQNDLSSIIANLQSHPNLRDWLGDRETWGEILQGLNVDAAGGQKRRLGRFLFAMNADKFGHAVDGLVSDMRGRSNENALTFHIFCGLAGGTGSGAVIDTIVQLRRKFPDPQMARILVYAYVPDINAPQGWATGNYHANAYAALLELNALGAGAWDPCDIKHGGKRVSSQHWFNGCYIFSDANDQGHRSAIDHDLLDIVADFVFHKTVVTRAIAWDDLGRFENSENGNATPEASSTRQPLRAVRFMSFGIKRLAFPEQTVREYLSYEFAAQAFHQLRFNNWQDGFGFLDNAPPESRAAFVADMKQQEEWRVTDTHLMLEREIIDNPAGSRWTDYATEWRSWESHYAELARRGSDPLKWLNEIQKLFLTAWQENFRSAGVPGHFAIMRRDMGEMARTIRNRVERQLFDEWSHGGRSLDSCARTVGALIDDLEARLQKIAASIPRRDAEEVETQRLIAAMEERWSKAHLPLIDSRKRELIKYAGLLRQKYVAKTFGEGTRFAKALGTLVVEQLVELRRALSGAEAAMAEAAEAAIKAVRERKPRGDVVALDGESYVTRIEDAETVEVARRAMVLDADEQRDATQKVRTRIVGALGQNPTFNSLSADRTTSSIRDIVVRASEENVEGAHQRLIQERRDRVIGVSIIEKLKTRWGDDPATLRREAIALAKSAGRFVTFDDGERNLDFPGKLADPRATESFAVLMPRPPEEREFVDALEAAFRAARPGAFHLIPTDAQRSNEITLVSLVNLFPLRFVRLIRQLRHEYERRIARDPARAALEIHLEGDGSQFPGLFLADSGEIETKARPALLLAEALDLIRENRSHETGRSALILLPADPLDEPVTIGSDMMSAAADFDETRLDHTRAKIAEAMAAGGTAHIEARARATDRIRQRIGAITAARGGDVNDPTIHLWRVAARAAIATLEGSTSL